MRTVALALLVLTIPGVAGPPPAAQALTRAAPRSAWSWPLTPVPEVVEAFDGPEHRWSRGHRGVDLAAAPGQAVLAPTSGVVVFVGRVVDRDVVSIEGPGGLRATLEPVTPAVSVGDAVTTGAEVGRVATTGPSHCAPRSCLHWGARVGRDTYLDPLLVLLAGGRPQAPVLMTPRGVSGPGGADTSASRSTRHGAARPLRSGPRGAAQRREDG